MAAQAFHAPDVLAEDLQKVLVDLTDLSLFGKQVHWNVQGKDFRSLHLYLDDVVTVARDGSDEIAERMRALFATPDARVSVVAQDSSLPQAPAGVITTEEGVAAIISAIEATVGTMRDVHEKVDHEDPASADILNDLIRSLEKLHWFIRSLKGVDAK